LGLPSAYLPRTADAEFSKGLAALRDFARNAGSTEPVIEPIDLFVFRRP